MAVGSRWREFREACDAFLGVVALPSWPSELLQRGGELRERHLPECVAFASTLPAGPAPEDEYLGGPTGELLELEDAGELGAEGCV